MSDLAQLIAQLGQQARTAARILAGTPPARIDAALQAMAAELSAAQTEILAANALDVAAAQAAGQTPALLRPTYPQPETPRRVCGRFAPGRHAAPPGRRGAA